MVLGFHSSNIHLLPGNTRFSTWGTGVSNTLYFFFLILCQEFKLVKAGDWQNLSPRAFLALVYQRIWCHYFYYNYYFFPLWWGESSFITQWLLLPDVFFFKKKKKSQCLNKQRFAFCGSVRSCHWTYKHGTCKPFRVFRLERRANCHQLPSAHTCLVSLDSPLRLAPWSGSLGGTPQQGQPQEEPPRTGAR